MTMPEPAWLKDIVRMHAVYVDVCVCACACVCVCVQYRVFGPVRLCTHLMRSAFGASTSERRMSTVDLNRITPGAISPSFQRN